MVPGGGVEPPRGCPRRILSPYLLQIRDLRLYYLQQLTWDNGEVPCGPVKGYFGSLDIVLGIVSRNGFPADLPMSKTSAIRQDAADGARVTLYTPHRGSHPLSLSPSDDVSLIRSYRF